MIRIVSIVCAMLAVCVAQGQSLESFKDTLSAYSESGARVTINESAEAQAALYRISQQPQKSTFLGYRIGIFFDNSASARANAEEAKRLFEESIEGERAYMVYENPYFKVSAGDCLTQEEAVILLNRVQRVFPKAYIMREQMEVERLVVREKPPISDSLSMKMAVDSLLMRL